MNYQCLIVDDEPLARKLLASHARRVAELDLVGECESSKEAISLIRTRKIDLLFLDIQMPDGTGLELARSLQNPPALILTTAFRHYAPEAFDLEAVDYLLKPISFDRFLKAVRKFLDTRQNLPPDMTVNSGFSLIRSERKLNRVLHDEVIYVESKDDFVVLHLKDRTLVTRESISTLAESLRPPGFVRIHRSFIVNREQVKTISAEGVAVGNTFLPFGRVYRREALLQLKS